MNVSYWFVPARWIILFTLFEPVFTPSSLQAQQALPDSGRIMLEVNSIPPDASVIMDSVYQGHAPLTIFVSKSRRHLLQVRVPEYVSYFQWIYKPGRDTLKINAKLKPNWAWLGIQVFPPRARARIDSADVTGILGELIRVSVGRHRLHFEDSAAIRMVDRTIEVHPGDTARIDARLGIPSSFPLMASAFIPGCGQFYDRAPYEGAGFMAGVAASVYFLLKAATDYNQAFADYQNNLAAYNKATGEVEALQLRKATLASLDKSNSLARKKNLFVGFSIGMYLANLVDVYLFHLKDDTIEYPSRFIPGSLTVSVGMNTRGIEFTMRIDL